MSNEVKRFRRRPNVIAAIQFDGTPKGAIEVFEGFEDLDGKFNPNCNLGTGHLFLKLKDGPRRVYERDWISKNSKGAFDVHLPDHFEAEYEEDSK